MSLKQVVCLSAALWYNTLISLWKDSKLMCKESFSLFAVLCCAVVLAESATPWVTAEEREFVMPMKVHSIERKWALDFADQVFK